MIVRGWELRRRGEPLVPAEWHVDSIAAGEVAVEVAACAVCHADVEFASGDGDACAPDERNPGSPPNTRAASARRPTRTLGHEIAGTVVDTSEQASEWLGRAVVVPPVLPCNDCDRCRSGTAPTCGHRLSVGRDVRGGFASHVVVPTRGLCVVDRGELAHSGVALPDLAMLAEAVAVPYQAIVRSRLRDEELAIFVGVGSVGGFGVQIASALDAHVIALDLVDDRLERAQALGASRGINVATSRAASVRQAIEEFARREGVRRRWKIYETSGTLAGQRLAVDLLNHGGCLSLVHTGCAEATLSLRHLQDLGASAIGASRSVAKYLPGALDLVLAGDVQIAPLVERRPMSGINEALEELSHHQLSRRPLLIPDFERMADAI